MPWQQPPGYTQSPDTVAAYFISSSSSSFTYTIAGNGTPGYTGDGGPATLAQLNEPAGTVLDSSGNLYIAEQGSNALRKIAANTGIITTVAGNGLADHTGDGGPAASAELWGPRALAIDGSGNLYIGETGEAVVRRIDATTGVITTYAGDPTATSTGDNGPATAALLGPITALACDKAGNLYIAENSAIRKVNASTGIITTVAGGGQAGFYGDGGPATSAGLNYPSGLAFDSAGNLYISDTDDYVIREVNETTGIINTVAGIAPRGRLYCGPISGDGGPATNGQLCYPAAIAIDAHNNLYIADEADDAIREVNAQTGYISTIAGVWLAPDTYAGDGYPATSVAALYPLFISVDAAGNLYFSNYYEDKLQKITVPAPPPATAAATPVFSVPSGTYATPQTVTISDATPGAEIYVSFPESHQAPTTNAAGLLGPFDVTGSVNISAVAVGPGYLPSAPASESYTISATPPTLMSTVAGGGTGGFTASGGSATGIELGEPQDIALDAGGNLYMADPLYNVIWEQSASTGNVSVFAGTGVRGYSGDNGPATSAQLAAPSGVAVDASGNVYISDSQNNRIRMVSAQTGIITTIAGPGNQSTLGDGGPATQAYINEPEGLVFDRSGNLYIADSGDYRVRMIAAKTGIITTVAGNGSAPTSVQVGDGGPATQANLRSWSIAVDLSGNIYISDLGRVRMVSAESGIISTVAGDGDVGTTGNGGLALDAEVSPGGIALDSQGNVYISDTGQVRKISKIDGTISLYAGNGYCGKGGDGGSATVAQICLPGGIAFDSAGNLYIADWDNALIRKVTAPPPSPTPVISLASGTYSTPQTVTIADSAASAAIYYTTDGSTPSIASTQYTGPITISQTTTLNAIAVVNGYAQSAAAVATYTINIPPPSFSMSATAVTIAPGSRGTSTITITSTNGYAGTVSLTCAVASSPANATDSPTCTASQTVTLTSGTASATATVTINTTSASASLSGHPARPDAKRWARAGSGAALAVLALLCLPSRRRFSRSLLTLALLATLAASLVACGGGGGSGTNKPPANPGTTAGAYTFTVTGTGNDRANTTSTTTFTLTVN